MNFFEFTKTDYDYLVKECMLDEEYSKLLEMKIKGYSITKMSIELNMSESSINRRIKELKRKIKKIL